MSQGGSWILDCFPVLDPSTPKCLTTDSRESNRIVKPADIMKTVGNRASSTPTNLCASSLCNYASQDPVHAMIPSGTLPLQVV